MKSKPEVLPPSDPTVARLLLVKVRLISKWRSSVANTCSDRHPCMSLSLCVCFFCFTLSRLLSPDLHASYNDAHTLSAAKLLKQVTECSDRWLACAAYLEIETSMHNRADDRPQPVFGPRGSRMKFVSQSWVLRHTRRPLCEPSFADAKQQIDMTVLYFSIFELADAGHLAAEDFVAKVDAIWKQFVEIEVLNASSAKQAITVTGLTLDVLELMLHSHFMFVTRNQRFPKWQPLPAPLAWLERRRNRSLDFIANINPATLFPSSSLATSSRSTTIAKWQESKKHQQKESEEEEEEEQQRQRKQEEHSEEEGGEALFETIACTLRRCMIYLEYAIYDLRYLADPASAQPTLCMAWPKDMGFNRKLFGVMCTLLDILPMMEGTRMKWGILLLAGYVHWLDPHLFFDPHLSKNTMRAQIERCLLGHPVAVAVFYLSPVAMTMVYRLFSRIESSASAAAASASSSRGGGGGSINNVKQKAYQHQLWIQLQDHTIDNANCASRSSSSSLSRLQSPSSSSSPPLPSSAVSLPSLVISSRPGSVEWIWDDLLPRLDIPYSCESTSVFYQKAEQAYQQGQWETALAWFDKSEIYCTFLRLAQDTRHIAPQCTLLGNGSISQRNAAWVASRLRFLRARVFGASSTKKSRLVDKFDEREHCDLLPPTRRCDTCRRPGVSMLQQEHSTWTHIKGEVNLFCWLVTQRFVCLREEEGTNLGRKKAESDLCIFVCKCVCVCAAGYVLLISFAVLLARKGILYNASNFVHCIAV